MDKIPGVGKPGSGITQVDSEKASLKKASALGLSNSRSTKIVNPTRLLLEQDRGVNKDLFDRKISLITWVKNRVSDFYWWMKGCTLTRKYYTGSLVAREFRYFSDKGHLARQLGASHNVKEFLSSSDYFNEVNTLFKQLRKLRKKENLYSPDASVVVKKSLEPDTCDTKSAITDLVTLKRSMEGVGIVLAETGNEELNAQLGTEYLEKFKSTPLARCYQFYLLSGGLVSAVAFLKAELAKLESVSKARQEYVEDVYKQLQKVQSLTLGLCHAELKAQMPGFYNDNLYTPLKVTDKRGVAYFRSDLVQPRGGWSDTKEAIAMARDEPA